MKNISNSHNIYIIPGTLQSKIIDVILILIDAQIPLIDMKILHHMIGRISFSHLLSDKEKHDKKNQTHLYETFLTI